MRTRLLSLSLWLSGSLAILAAPPAEPPPSKPFVGNAPASAHWTVTYRPKSPEKKPVTDEDIRARKMRERYSPLVSSKRTIKAPGKMVVYTTYEADLQSETWLVGNYLYELPMREGESMQIKLKSRDDFPEASWIKAENFRGTVELDQHKVYLYEVDAPDTDAGPSPSPSAQPDEEKPSPSPAKDRKGRKPRKEKEADKPKDETAPKPKDKAILRAYIDTETKLPVKIETSTTTMTYQFENPPAVFPEMSASAAQMIKLPKE